MRRIVVASSLVAAVAFAVRADDPLSPPSAAGDELAAVVSPQPALHADPFPRPSRQVMGAAEGLFRYDGHTPEDLTREELEDAYAEAVRVLARSESVPGRHLAWAEKRLRRQSRLLQARDSLVQARELLAAESDFDREALDRLNAQIKEIEASLGPAGWRPAPGVFTDGVNRKHWTPPPAAE